MRIAVVADRGLEEELRAAGHEIVALTPPPAPEGEVTAPLAVCLREFEGRLEADGADAAVVCAPGDGELALAIVAVKLGIHLARVDRPGPEQGPAGAARALAVLADEVLEPGGTPRMPAS